MFYHIFFRHYWVAVHTYRKIFYHKQKFLGVDRMIKHFFVNISANFRQNGRMEYSGAWGTLLQEKT
jgi:hypothetical protein